jgi:hypothetical protein
MTFIDIVKKYQESGAGPFFIESYKDTFYIFILEKIEIKNCFNGFLSFVIDPDRLVYEVFNRKRGSLISDGKFVFGFMNKDIRELLGAKIAAGDPPPYSLKSRGQSYYVGFKRSEKYQKFFIINVVSQ